MITKMQEGKGRLFFFESFVVKVITYHL